MASERQIAANRRNACKSTGPRSASGKKRSSKNAFRHGLTVPPSGAKFAQEVETLAHQIMGGRTDEVALAFARDAAAATLELARVRRFKSVLIERVAACGSFNPPKLFRSRQEEALWMMGLWTVRPQLDLDPVPPMPTEKPERATEAIRRALPELVRLARYESRAAARRDRAIRGLIGRELSKYTT